MSGELDDGAGKVARRTTPRENTDDGAHQDPEDNNQDSGGEFGVEAIRGHRFVRGKLHYEIKWQGCPDEENTEEPESDLLL